MYTGTPMKRGRLGRMKDTEVAARAAAALRQMDSRVAYREIAISHAPRALASGRGIRCAERAVHRSARWSFKPNPWGFYDVHGNLWEMCLDTIGHYRRPVADGNGLRQRQATSSTVPGGAAAS